MSEELKACPFCGGDAESRKYESDFFCQCIQCFGSTCADYQSEHESISAWNRRAQAAPEAEPVAWANWKVGTKSYVPYRSIEEAERCVRGSELAATQLGPYKVVPLYTAPQHDADHIPDTTKMVDAGLVEKDHE